MLADIFCSESRRYSHFFKEPRQRLTMLFPGAGCEWRKMTGGCSMCGFYEANKKISFGLLLPSFLFKLIFLSAAKKLAAAEELAVYNGGSFLNKGEVPLKFQNWFFSKMAGYSGVKEVFIESRCEYLEEGRIKEIAKILGKGRLVMGIGLESQDDHIRNDIIKKGLLKKFFEEKIKMLKSLGVTSSAYVFLKPPGLSEKEALEETLATIVYALSVGVDRVNISSAFVQAKTETAAAYKRGEYRPPKLWTVLKIIDRIKEEGWPVSIGGFKDWPPPLAIPANCGKCSGLIYEAIEEFRQTGILGAIPICSCKDE
jgi:radical SAM enzyme (TIGR01210 family)